MLAIRDNFNRNGYGPKSKFGVTWVVGKNRISNSKPGNCCSALHSLRSEENANGASTCCPNFI